MSRLKREKEDNSHPAGTVIEQSRIAGSSIQGNTSITITVAVKSATSEEPDDTCEESGLC